jgi:hypothetical protein
VTTYTPYPTITINDTIQIPDNALSSIRISYGRKDVLEQPATGYANMEFWTEGDVSLDIHLSDAITISINKGTSGTNTVFTGTVSDIIVSFDGYGSIGSIARYSVTAVAPLAQLNKRLAGYHNYNEELDGVRVKNIITDALVTTWAEIVGLTPWSSAPEAISWSAYDSINQDLIDELATSIDAGEYSLVAYNSGEANALTLAQDAANSGRGVLWEHPDGTIHYSDYSARALETPFTLTEGDLRATGISVDAKWGEIYNYVAVDYATGTAFDEDITSQQLYGRLAATKTTTLKHSTDALQQAQDYIKSRAYARVYPEALSVPLHSPTVSNATRDLLTDMKNGMYLETNVLPLVMGGELRAFVEGWEWDLTRYTADLTMFLSGYSETYSSTIWYQVPQTITWATYNNTVIWENA